MPATVSTSEIFEDGVTEDDMDEQVRLRIKAGAIESSYSANSDGGWTLVTTWNVIGEQ